MWRWLLAALGLLALLLLLVRGRPATESAPAETSAEKGAGAPALAEPAALADPTPLDEGRKGRTLAEESGVPRTGAAVVRVVWGDSAEPLGDVKVQAHHEDGEGTVHEGTTDERGEWHVTGLVPGATFFGTIRGIHRLEELALGETIHVELEIPDGVDVRGRVVDQSSAPVPAAAVMGDYGRSPQWAATTDGLGRFFLRDMSPGGENGEGSQLFARAPGHTRSRVRSVVGDPGDTLEVELVVTAGAGDLEVFVLGPEGDPPAACRCDVQDSTPLFKRLGDGSTVWRAPIDPEPDDSGPGTYRYVGLAPGPVWITIWPEGLPKRTVEAEIVTGGTTSVTIDLSEPVPEEVEEPVGPPLGGVVVDAAGVTVEKWEVMPLDRNGNVLRAYRQVTDTEGRFRMKKTPLGTFTLAVSPQNVALSTPVLEEAGFVPGDLDLVLRLPVELPVTGQLHARIRGPGGEPAVNAGAWIARDGQEEWSGLPRVHGGARLRIELMPGRYRLLCSADDAAYVETEPFVIVAGQTNDIGDIELRVGGTVEVRLTLPSGVEESLAQSASVWHARKGLVSPLVFQDDLGRSRQLPAGSYLVRVLHPRWFGLAEVEVVPNTTVSVEILVEPAIERQLVLTLPGDATYQGVGYVALRDAEGRMFFREIGWVKDRRVEIVVPGLRPGTYSVELEKKWNGTLEIDTFEAPDVLAVELE